MDRRTFTGSTGTSSPGLLMCAMWHACISDGARGWNEIGWILRAALDVGRPDTSAKPKLWTLDDRKGQFTEVKQIALELCNLANTEKRKQRSTPHEKNQKKADQTRSVCGYDVKKTRIEKQCKAFISNASKTPPEKEPQQLLEPQ